jgi:hypothetical protein
MARAMSSASSTSRMRSLVLIAPADNAPAAGIENHREIQEPCGGRNIGDVRHPKQIRFVGGELAVNQVRRLTAGAPHGRGHELAAADPTPLRSNPRRGQKSASRSS